MRVYLVTYDITQPKRLRRVHRTLRAWGDAVQYSPYLCNLRSTASETAGELAVYVLALPCGGCLTRLSPRCGRTRDFSQHFRSRHDLRMQR